MKLIISGLALLLLASCDGEGEVGQVEVTPEAAEAAMESYPRLTIAIDGGAEKELTIEAGRCWLDDEKTLALLLCTDAYSGRYPDLNWWAEHPDALLFELTLRDSDNISTTSSPFSFDGSSLRLAVDRATDRATYTIGEGEVILSRLAEFPGDLTEGNISLQTTGFSLSGEFSAVLAR